MTSLSVLVRYCEFFYKIKTDTRSLCNEISVDSISSSKDFYLQFDFSSNQKESLFRFLVTNSILSLQQFDSTAMLGTHWKKAEKVNICTGNQKKNYRNQVVYEHFLPVHGMSMAFARFVLISVSIENSRTMLIFIKFIQQTLFYPMCFFNMI